MAAPKRERSSDSKRPAKFARIKEEHVDHVKIPSPPQTCGSQSQQDDDEVARALGAGLSDGGGDEVAVSCGGQENGPLDVPHWVPKEAVALMRVLLDYKSTAPDPWFALAKLPLQGCGWEVRSPTQSIMTVDGTVVRLFTVGAVTGKCFYTSLGDPEARSRITIRLMRSEDKAALGGMHERARLQGEAGPSLLVDRFTAIAVHPHDQAFRAIFNATRSFRAREDMSTVHPFDLHVGDFVLVESIVVRTEHGRGWKVSYRADGIFRLAERPEPIVSEGVVDLLHVPPVRFPHWL